jgi:2-oxoglutarate dehydrogenase E1 component
MASTLDSILTGANATYIAEIYSRYLAQPASVDPSWAALFAEIGDDVKEVLDELRGASWSPSDKKVIGGNGDNVEMFPHVSASGNGQAASQQAAAPAQSGVTRRATLDTINALMMIRVYRVRGHLIAKFDPLGLEGRDYHPELDPLTYGFGEEDMDRPIFINNVLGMETATIREILQVLRETYCGSIGVEYMHISDQQERAWIQQRMESIRNQTHFTQKGKEAIYDRLVEAEGFEAFLNTKYPGTKRFGLDGGESLIPGIEQVLKRGSQLGVKEIILGMPHRGRLNVLTSIMSKSYVAMFSEFQGVSAMPEDVLGSGDVKYHLGTSADRNFDGNSVHLSLMANPSHLEVVNPVVIGKVRAKQFERGDEERHQVMGLLMHGDAAFPGQGIVPESLLTSQLKGYRTGGTVHFIVNNQIGFTAAPSRSRSSPYCSDIAKSIVAPIFHVNGDDPEAVVHVARMATEYRQEFKKDVVIDLYCYRRHGHNEGDEPMFTQPIMYKAIAKHPNTRQVYGDQLIREGVLTEAEAQQRVDDFRAKLEKDFEASASYKPNKADWLEGKWQGIVQLTDEEELAEYPTAASLELLKEVGTAISEPPAHINVNSKILRLLKNRRKMIDTGEGIDWGMGEALAFGTLLREGTPVRLSGEDSTRGTFSHRHAAIVDQDNEEHFYPLSEMHPDQATFEVMDSPLSEAGVLGFEYGYALTEPKSLVIWEAQFGDFANMAQCIIDQFIASGESKWLRLCGLVMLLPHGFEGQGPEHSSARVERYLQLCAEDNMQVVNCTTPANFFHALRRQIHRNFRKPLIVFTPKSLLRHKLVVSKIGEFGPGTQFSRIFPEIDRLDLDKKVRRILFCSGKVYYDLLQARRDQKIKDVAIVRVEQLYPWPRTSIFQQISRYPNAEVVWCQEEPANNGGWMFVLPRFEWILEELERKQLKPIYVGRTASASPATGSGKEHQQEQALLVEQALNGKIEDLPQPFRRIKK